MKSQRFFVTGLPRSRTAWMSVFLTTGKTLCYHDACAGMTDLDDLDAIYDSDYYSHIGISDSGLGFFIDRILEKYSPKVVVIDRDMAEVEESMRRANLTLGLPSTNFCEVLMDKLRSTKGHPNVMWLPFEAMNEKRVMQKVFWHLMPGADFDEVRYEELSKMQIETDLAKTFSSISAKQQQSNLAIEVAKMITVEA